jgi:DNA-binding transcriptional MerR regulator
MNKPDTRAGRDLFSISDLADEFGMSTRAIRFYESKGMLAPGRVGNTRVFRRRDRARLALIARGKRLGLSLVEISEYLSLYDADVDDVAYDGRLLERIDARLDGLERQRSDVETAIDELRQIRQLAHARRRRQD